MGHLLHRFVRPVATATLDDTVADAARLMRQRCVGALVVVRDGRPVGIVTDRDIVLRVVAEGRDAKTTRVADVVTYDPIVLGPSDGLDTTFERIRTRGIRRLPLVDEAGKLVGLVTADDLVMLLGRELAALADGIDGACDGSESR